MNDLVQITLNADQEKYNIGGDERITFIDANSYYIGHITARRQGWIVLETIDQSGNRGGIAFIKENQIAKIEDNTAVLNYFASTGIKDPFHMKQMNQIIKQMTFTDSHELLLNLVRDQPLITFEVDTGMTYTGLVTLIDQDEVRILEKSDTELEHFATVIPLKDIVCIDVNSIDNYLFVHYLKQREEFNRLNLVEIYFDYTFDDQFGNFAVGRVLKYDENNILLESLNELGQVESIAVISRQHVAHVTEESERLNYFNYLVDWQQKNHSFDPDNLERSINLHGEIKSIAEVIQEWPEDRVIKISDSIYHYPDRLGLIQDCNDESFDLKILTEYNLSETSDHNYEDLISVDLAGSDMLKMQKYIERNG